MPGFDSFSKNYDLHLNSSLRISGEPWIYFAKKRLEFSFKLLQIKPDDNLSILDFGCGIGNLFSVIKDHYSNLNYTGIDVSKESIKIAKTKYNTSCFYTNHVIDSGISFDLIYTNGVFHHIDHQRHEFYFNQIYNSLKENGTFIFWENNPLNLGTRYVMSQNPFDKDAQLIYHWEISRKLEQIGFTKIKNYSYFYFPSILKKLRFLENSLSCLPFGAQYLLLASK